MDFFDSIINNSKLSTTMINFSQITTFLCEYHDNSEEIVVSSQIIPSRLNPK